MHICIVKIDIIYNRNKENISKQLFKFIKIVENLSFFLRHREREKKLKSSKELSLNDERVLAKNTLMTEQRYTIEENRYISRFSRTKFNRNSTTICMKPISS